MREETNGKYPRISIWENVAGALTSNKGADFGIVLDAMAEAGAMVCEWRLLDAQYFGIPQRRRRVFLVAVFDSDVAERSSNPILSLSEGLRRYPAPSSSERQGSPGEVAASPRGEGSGVAYTKSKRPRSVENDETWEAGRPAPTLNAFDQGDVRSTTVVVAASEGQGVISFPTNFGSYAQATEEIAQSMAVKAGPPSIMQENHARPVGQPVLGSEIVGPLSACDWKYPQNQQLAENKFIVAEEPVLMRQREGKAGGGKGPLLSHNKSLTLAVNNDQYLFQAEEDPILFENSYRDNVRVQHDGIFPTLTAKMGTGGNNTPMLAHEQPVAFSIREDAKANTFSATQLDRANALSALQPSPQSHHAQMFITDVALESPPRMIVRRLMPIECERLMGWPDDWTRWRADGKEQADTHRYKQCGNGVASPCSEWIGGIIARLLGGSS
jgi:DNA (cytosine-5)-methyltransferase 1